MNTEAIIAELDLHPHPEGGHYRETDYRSYLRRRTEELLEAGITIDLGPPRLQ